MALVNKSPKASALTLEEKALSLRDSVEYNRKLASRAMRSALVTLNAIPNDYLRRYFGMDGARFLVGDGLSFNKNGWYLYSTLLSESDFETKDWEHHIGILSSLLDKALAHVGSKRPILEELAGVPKNEKNDDPQYVGFEDLRTL